MPASSPGAWPLIFGARILSTPPVALGSKSMEAPSSQPTLAPSTCRMKPAHSTAHSRPSSSDGSQNASSQLAARRATLFHVQADAQPWNVLLRDELAEMLLGAFGNLDHVRSVWRNATFVENSTILVRIERNVCAL